MDRYFDCHAQLFRAYWGYPIIPDQSNPYFNYLKRLFRQERLNGLDSSNAQAQTAQMLILPISDRTPERIRIWGARHDSAEEAFVGIASARDLLQQLSMEVASRSLSDQLYKQIRKIDELLDFQRRILGLLRVEDAHRKCYPAYDLRGGIEVFRRLGIVL